MKCFNCGTENAEEARFCQKCGVKIEALPSAQEMLESFKGEKPSDEVNDSVEISVDQERSCIPNDIGSGTVSGTTSPAEVVEAGFNSEEKAINANNDGQNSGIQEENLEPMQFCPFCGRENDGDAVFCSFCGKNMVEFNEEVHKPKGKKLRKIITVAAIAVAGLAALYFFKDKVLSGRNVSNETSFSRYVAYAKEGKLYQIDSQKPKKDPVEYDVKLGDDESGITLIQYSKNNKYMAYPVKYNGTPFRLDTQTVGAKNESERVDSDVMQYTLLDNGDIIYRDGDGNLYLKPRKGNKTKIDSDVFVYFLNKDRDRVTWIVESGDEYHYYYRDLELKKEKVKLFSSQTPVYTLSRNYKHIACTDNGDLFLCKDYGEKQKIASDIRFIIGVTDDGDVIYSKFYDEGQQTFYDLIDDEEAFADENATYPEESDYMIETTQQKSDGSYEKITEFDEVAYEKALQEYEMAMERESLRDELNVFELDAYLYPVYIYKQGEEQILAEACSHSNFNFYSQTLELTMCDLGELKEWLNKAWINAEEVMSEFHGVSSLINKVTNEDARTVRFDIKTGKGFELVYDDDTADGDLYEYGFNNGMGATNLIADEVSEILYTEGDDVLYKKADGSFYINNKKIDDDVNSVWYGRDDMSIKNFYYIKDVNDSSYTLCKYNGNDTETIGEDIYEDQIIGNGKVVFISDFSEKQREGILYYYDGKKKVLIDEEVQGIN